MVANACLMAKSLALGISSNALIVCSAFESTGERFIKKTNKKLVKRKLSKPDAKHLPIGEKKFLKSYFLLRP